ncbi:MAG: hup [Clostridiaceae bacterium]|jgi:DNA-binding protein HU-beta|nr:hup [Clostridiaceae bacterium]
MNKGELVTAIAEKTGFTKKDTEIYTNGIIDSITEAMSKGDKVSLVGFGNFEVKDRKEREGRNPRNPKETVIIPASKAPTFKAGKTLKEEINK